MFTKDLLNNIFHFVIECQKERKKGIGNILHLFMFAYFQMKCMDLYVGFIVVPF